MWPGLPGRRPSALARCAWRQKGLFTVSRLIRARRRPAAALPPWVSRAPFASCLVIRRVGLRAHRCSRPELTRSMIFALRAACLCVCAFGGSPAAGLPACAQNLAPAGAETDAPTQRAEPVPRPRREAARPRQKNEKDARLAARPPAGAAPRQASRRSGVEEANSWLIFGFSEGSDVGAKGEWTLFYDSVLRASAHAAGLGGWDGAAGIGNSPSDRAVVSIAVTPSLERNGEPIATPAAGTSWRDARGFGALASLKYQLLRRDEAPVGLAVQISPYWQHVPKLGRASCRE